MIASRYHLALNHNQLTHFGKMLYGIIVLYLCHLCYVLTGGAGDTGRVTAWRGEDCPQGVPLFVLLQPHIIVSTQAQHVITPVQVVEGDPGVQDVVERDLCREARRCPVITLDYPGVSPLCFHHSPRHVIFIYGFRFTYFHREAWRQAQSDEVTQLRKQGVGDGHEVDDRGHLFCQREGMGLAQPQFGFKPGKHES